MKENGLPIMLEVPFIRIYLQCHLCLEKTFIHLPIG